ncbi:MAG TPA: GDSL-type esterase/lipase family protein [Thermoanaerobaculia bacterium]
MRLFARAAILASLLAPSAFAVTPSRQVHVAFVGDSLAYGAGDEDGKGIAGRLETELRVRGVGATTTNLGANGATIRDLAAKLQDARARADLAAADAIVLSAGANDLRRAIASGDPLLTPFDIVGQVLDDIRATVAELHRINPKANVMILGAYVPVAQEKVAIFLEPIVALWDTALMAQFLGDPLVSVVRMSDIVDRPERLSTLDSFHPGGEAYQEMARRIAALLDGPREEAVVSSQ